MTDSQVVIVGAGLGGLRTAEQLRAAGHAGPVMVLGAEPHLPYNRPPLSKELLADPDSLILAQMEEKVAFRRRSSIADVTFRPGRPVVAADLAAGTLQLAGDGDGAAGDEIRFDGLVIATGLRPRRILPQAAGQGAVAHVLRTLEDCLALRAALRPGRRVAIVGGGFVGCEVACTALRLGCEVTVIEAFAAPMIRVLGAELATAIQRFHEAAGIRFRVGALVASAAPGTIELSDGERIAADVIVEATGSLTNVEWLDGNGLDLSDGVLCDNTLAVGEPRAAGWHGRVVAVGDVARFPNPLYDDVPRRVEHWSMPGDTAKRAAATLHAALTGTPGGEPAPFAPLPSFWTDQLDLRLWSYGSPALGDEARVAEGDPGDPLAGLIVTYHRDGRHIGTVTLNTPPKRHRELREALLKEKPE